MPESPHPPALGMRSKREDAPQRIPAKPLPRVPTARAGPSPPGGPRLGGAKQRAQPQRRPRPEPIGPRPLLPPPAGQPAGRASRRARVEPPRRPRARAPARSGRSPDVPAAPARAHPAPSRAAQPLPGVPGGCEGLHGRCPESPEPGRALGGGGGASLTAQRLRGAPGPRGAPGIFFWETSPQSVGLSSRAGKVLSAGRLRPSGNFAGM